MKNFTPHAVRIILGDEAGQVYWEIPSAGVCRAIEKQSYAYEVYVPESGRCRKVERPNWTVVADRSFQVMRRTEYSGLEWTPAEPEGPDAVIVSIVAAPVVVAHRPDLTVYVPDTGPDSAVRGVDGRIEAVRRLVLWHDPRGEDTIRAVEPFNIMNPYDGWVVKMEEQLPENRDAAISIICAVIEFAFREGGLMIDHPARQPFDPPKDWIECNQLAFAKTILESIRPAPPESS